jgi:hypothetical protein
MVLSAHGREDTVRPLVHDFTPVAAGRELAGMDGRELRDRLIGAWKLVSSLEEPVRRFAAVLPLGENPRGIIMYTPTDMSAQRSGDAA